MSDTNSGEAEFDKDGSLDDISENENVYNSSINEDENLDKSEENSAENGGVLEQEPLLDISYLQENSHNDVDKLNKRDEGLVIRDELDFEEDKESGEEGEDLNEGEEYGPTEKVINKEEGELSEEDEDESLLRQEPKTVCRFFNKGQCTWGTNCRFLHPGVSDKGNYNMFAPPKPQSQSEDIDNSPEKEKEVRRPVYEAAGFESAWERGLRYAKEMKKRASKRKETDADFEEKRFNLSLGQAELDRENDYYTRPASPVYKPTDEVIEYLDPYEKQAIRHFRGGHFENLEVRYNVDPAYPNRGAANVRSRRDKFEREVTERIPRKMRVAQPGSKDDPKIIKEKRYPKPPKGYKEERHPELGKGEAEVWADPWARRKTPVGQIRKKKISRTRSYSSGSSSRSSRSSRSSSYTRSSYSRSRSSRSRSSSSSRSITPPIHPRQRGMNRGGMRGGQATRGFRGRGGRGGERGGRHMNYQNNYQNQFNQFPNQQMNPYHNQFPNHNQQFGQPQNYPPNHPLANRGGAHNRRGNMNDTRPLPLGVKQEPNRKYPQEEPPIIQRNIEERQPPPTEPNERVDMFGRTIRKDVPRSPTPKSVSRSPVRTHGRRKFSLSPSRSVSSRSSSRSSRSYSKSRSRSRSVSRSPSRSKSSSSSPEPIPISPISRKKERDRKHSQGTVSYGENVIGKAIDIAKVAGQKQQIKLTLKKQGAVRPIDKTVIGEEDDSGESDVDARILKKRKLDTAPPNVPAAKVAKPAAAPAQNVLPTAMAGAAKKPSAARREELLKQLRAVEDAIARKRSKPLV